MSFHRICGWTGQPYDRQGKYTLAPQLEEAIRELRPEEAAEKLPGFGRERGARLLRFPGGNLANTFCWPSMRASDKSMVTWEDWSWGTGPEPFLSFVGSVGGEPMYSLNPFDHVIDGRPHDAVAEARALVRLFVSRGYAGAFYEVGNENDGSWNPMLSPPDYVERFVTLGEAVKREDPSARLLGPVGSGSEASWRDGFIDGLAARGKLPLLDYFAFHYYGGFISNTNSAGINLASPQQVPGFVQAIRERLAAAGGAGIGVALTEYNAAIWDTGAVRGQYTIEQALWLADTAGELFGCIDLGNLWIDLTADDPHGLLTDRTSPPTRTKNYWPMYLVGRTLGLGRRDASVDVLGASTDQSSSRATVHAVRGSDGSVGVLLVNKGDALTAQEYQHMVQQVARYTGLKPEYVDQANLRIDVRWFTHMLLADQKLRVGRLDGRYAGPDPNGFLETPFYDPTGSATQPPFTEVFYDYVRRELNYKTDMPYKVFAYDENAFQNWEWGKAVDGFPSTAGGLRSAMIKNPYMKILVMEGHYDLATPFAAADWTMDHLNLDGKYRQNVSYATFDSGHMVYIDRNEHNKMKKDVVEFMDKCLK